MPYDEPPKIDDSSADRPRTGLTARLERLSRKPYASWALFSIACIEGAVFPLPPDPLFFTLAIGDPKRSFRFAAISGAGSFLGSLVGYLIGYALFESFGRVLLSSLGVLGVFNDVLEQYHEHGMLTLVLSGFTPVPYAVVTIAAGFNQTLPFATLVLGSLLGRAIRFGILGALFTIFGGAAKRFLERHRTAMVVAMAAFFILSIAVMRWLL